MRWTFETISIENFQKFDRTWVNFRILEDNELSDIFFLSPNYTYKIKDHLNVRMAYLQRGTYSTSF